ncbi:MAG: hypothetical protein KAI24_17880 [Planctomycetes bacterium]|nr:hypothetical protein [Planctomycetota bacterium]
MSARDGGGFRIRYRDFAFLEFDGRDATTPAMQKALAAVTTLTAAIPDLDIEADGTFGEAVGIDDVMDRMVTFLAKQRGWSEQKAADVRAQMGTPALTAVMADASGRYWRNWAEAWIGWDLAAGKERRRELEMPVLGSKFEVELTQRNLGAAAEHPGCIALESHVRSEGQKFSQAMIGFVSELIVQFDGDPRALTAKLSFAFDEQLTVVTDPKTLLPRVATSERTVTAHDAGSDETRKQVERHRYEFDWSNGKDGDGDRK